MPLQFESLQHEKDFDHACSLFLERHRFPGRDDLAKIMQRAHDNLAATGLPPSPSAFERAFLELHSEGEVALVTEKLVESLVEKPEVLTVEDYRKLPASTVARRYLVDRDFRKSVDSLIARKLI
jgi:hypothetical protein